MSETGTESSNDLTARQAAEMLGVSVTTIYAYVSRGLLTSVPVAPGNRSRRYNRSEVERLVKKREERRDPAKAVAGALDFGVPVLESSITLISGGRCYYRGYDSVKLARSRTFEEVAELIWLGELPRGPSELFADLELALPPGYEQLVADCDPEPVERLQVFLALAALHDLSCHDPRPAALARSAAGILRRMAVAACGSDPRSGARLRVAEILRKSWCKDLDKAHVDGVVKLFDAALLLSADHELNVSSFTARCAASAGTTPYEVVTAGLATLRGRRHGGLSDRTEAFLHRLHLETGTGPESVERALVRRLKQGEMPPGFGHPLYPLGDPRTCVLFELLAQLAPDPRRVRWADDVANSVFRLTGERPTIDFGLASASIVLGLPPGAALALFALGRTVGWIGQALEQIESGRLIRPRARYKGRPPVDP